jgi:hypothetical protein
MLASFVHLGPIWHPSSLSEEEGHFRAKDVFGLPSIEQTNCEEPIPIAFSFDCFDKLAKAKVFSKLDLRHGYYQCGLQMEMR